MNSLPLIPRTKAPPGFRDPIYPKNYPSAKSIIESAQSTDKKVEGLASAIKGLKISN